jgi:RNA polymerase sigma-70 factor (ECF subfamily)
VSLEARNEIGTKPRGFSTTRWSVIISGAKIDTEEATARAALAELCQIYWRPIFLFIFRRGYSPEDAQDLTQDFFTMILQTNWLRHADRSRGRFRSLLLKSLQNFLHDASEKKDARKRGGGMQIISWDDWMAEAPSQLTISARALDSFPPERLFDLRWAATVVEQALRRLGDECERKGKVRLFDALSGHLTAERGDTSYSDIAKTLGVPESVVKAQLHNMRQRYRWLLRDEVAKTVENPEDVDDEIRYLCAALAAGT